MGETIERHPLFPLGLVLLPHEAQALHVFEERYKTMVSQCLENDSEFGIVWMADDGLREVGCSVEITQVVDRMEDGRMNILVRGTRPVRLMRRAEDLPYPAGDVEVLEDEPEPPDEHALETAHAAYAELVERATDSRPDDSDLAQLDSYGMAGTISFELDEKQELLELRSESRRLILLTSLCIRALERLDYAEKAGERARTNGKVRH
jgi:Lon protease-like protein